MIALLRELKDSINFQNKLSTLRLLKYLVFIAENYVIEYIVKISDCFVTNFKYDEKGELVE